MPSVRDVRKPFAVLLVLLVAAVAGCGGGHTTAPDRPAAAAATHRCADADKRAKDVRLRTSDGVSLSGSVIGAGPAGAVLIHEYPRDRCGWWPYARYLAHHGVHVLLFDLRCFGASPCPGGRGHATDDVTAAVAALRREGAKRVVLVGASMGGSIAVTAAARLHPAALVDLSGEPSTKGLTPGIDANALADAPRVTSPALFAVARGDRYVSPGQMRAVAGRIHSPAHRVIVLPPAAGHGWDMLFGTSRTWSPLARTVAAFVRRHAG
jgi:pimeloyl-ACP methyl ester carboxylesterase